MKSGKKSKLITIIESEYLFFVFLKSDGSQEIVHKALLDELLNSDTTQPDIPKAVLAKTNDLMIIPDYWLGNNYYSFLSKKRSLIAPFVERKLKSEITGFEEIDDFYGYTTFKASDREQNLHVFFLQDPTAYALYHRLSDLGISPIRMTTPALLWQHILSETYGSDFSTGGKGLVHLEDKNCYLYFFFKGQFLFSRRISLPETGMDADEKINLLNYEVNQSFYLFSQKTKAGVDALYFMSADTGIMDQLSESLNKTLILCETAGPDILSDISKDDILDLLRPIIKRDISPQDNFLSISYKPLSRELEWRPIQNMGIAVGIVLLVFLLSESVFLKAWSNTGFLATASAYSSTRQDPKQLLRKYAEALDKVTENKSRTALNQLLVDLYVSMPEHTSITKALVSTGSPSEVNIEAAILASGPDQFKEKLSLFTENFNKRFNVLDPLTEKDIDVRMDHQTKEIQDFRYIINFKGELP